MKTTLQFAYTLPGKDLRGAEKAPYIVASDEGLRLILSPTENVVEKMRTASFSGKSAVERWLDSIEGFTGIRFEGSSLEGRVDAAYHHIFPERIQTHLEFNKIDIANVSRILDRRTSKILASRDEAESLLTSGRRLRIKYGIDPTGSRIHIGHSVPVLLLRDLQRMGHKIVFLVGTFTAQIGDPEGRDQGRHVLTEETIQQNIASYVEQISSILDTSAVEFVFNADWYNQMQLAKFFSLLRQYSLGELSSRKFVKDRQEKKVGISMAEFLYPVLQGWDSVEVLADIAVSGEDQEFNELQGRVLQSSHGLTAQSMMMTPLIPGSDNRKMSKSYDNCIYIDDEPEIMFEKLMRIHDDVVKDYLPLVTTLEHNELEQALGELGRPDSNLVAIKQELAHHMVTFYHSEEHATTCQRRWTAKFLQKQPEDIPTTSMAQGTYGVIQLLTASGVAQSKRKAIQQVTQGGVRVNEVKTTNPDATFLLSPETPSIMLRFGSKSWGRINLISDELTRIPQIP